MGLDIYLYAIVHVTAAWHVKSISRLHKLTCLSNNYCASVKGRDRLREGERRKVWERQ